ncbi:NUDIX domain-containing protein [Oceanicella actignis]|uniref:NUDIX domain-containing protein n=1 Tax=Oceanicella actignis TaxID=1189325 RepID=UPI00125C1DA3|nr:NUDIX domain-containing protein [Oceanicella actignis]TYO90893.1 nudix-type nucleoside diphosphatase (YffH/AdpP family) [Oceanicella actignis]
MTAPRFAMFFYGSLRDAELLSVVLGRTVAEEELIPAALADHELRAVKGEDFPIALPRAGARVPGVFLDGLDADEIARIRFFEDDDEFVLREVEVELTAAPGGTRPALTCFPREALTPAGTWSFEAWRDGPRPALLECAREIMQLHERGADWSDPALWPGIRNRALARVRAAREKGAPRPAGLGRDRVRVLSRRIPYASYIAVEELEIAHPTHGGGMSAPLRRAAVSSGDAVTVLPYDARRDLVLLVSQWRPGPHLRGDRDPWPLEVVAGRVDRDERDEDVARREAREEAGLELGALERVGAYYPSPGVLAEKVTSFVGQADLGGAGGVHGLAEEGEDIRAMTMPFDEAMALVRAGGVDSGPALVSLLWLAMRREALRTAWGA